MRCWDPVAMSGRAREMDEVGPRLAQPKMASVLHIDVTSNIQDPVSDVVRCALEMLVVGRDDHISVIHVRMFISGTHVLERRKEQIALEVERSGRRHIVFLRFRLGQISSGSRCR
jgi:hypothetical protein